MKPPNSRSINSAKAIGHLGQQTPPARAAQAARRWRHDCLLTDTSLRSSQTSRYLYRLSVKPVSVEIAEPVVSRKTDDREPTLTPLGCDARIVVGQLNDAGLWKTPPGTFSG